LKVEQTLPTRLPDKSRAKSIRADHRSTLDERDGTRNHIRDVSKPRAADKSDSIDNIDWLALCALSLAVSAMFIAALVYLGEDDATGAAAVLAGTACIIAVALLVTKPPVERA
jgi:hypothetical protein